MFGSHLPKILFAVLFAMQSVLTPASAQTKILFLGNSFTHGHNGPALSYNKSAITDANHSGHGGVPGMFKKLTTQAGVDFDVTIEAVSGETLAYHLKEKAATISNTKWDVVVLQENSLRPLPVSRGGDPAAFIAGADGLLDLIRARNPAARVILYETWASPTSASANGYRGDLQAMQNDLTNAYYLAKKRSLRTAGKPDFAAVARVGDAFMRAVDQGLANPKNDSSSTAFTLWAEDDRHAGRYGSYLAALVLFGKITGIDPQTLGTGTGTAASDLGISSQNANDLHRIAFETNSLDDPALVN